MHLRTMTLNDIPAGMRLKDIAGWNQTEADWKRFLEGGSDGCFVAEIDGNICGTAATITFENRFAWVSMVLVDPQYRNRGVGTRLLEKCLAYLDERNIRTIKLDATPLGKPLYSKLGFVPEYEIERWVLKKPSGNASSPSSSPVTASFSARQLDLIVEADCIHFGADRGSLLRSLYDIAPSFARAVWSETGGLAGYIFGRSGSFADQIGPWVASDANSARQLFENSLAHSNRQTVIVDCMKENHAAIDLAREFGFVFSRPLTRMYRGPNPHPGKPEKLFAIIGPEFG